MMFDMNGDYTLNMSKDWAEIAPVFAALADVHRQGILLGFAPGERLNVGQIAAASPLARSTVSHHLKVLREAGVLIARREGKEIHFQVNKDFVLEALALISRHLDAAC